ncbi:GPP34 family phosphoprotein [Streptomyces sp. ODS28]|uniref:GPP34 family phosphoprotein n=1 Tax=Streptomyces sp. ODS28 TaxID=3136688 RepID=UPI0031EA2D10
MTTPWDLVFTALDAGPGGSGEAGDLALALAGAELIDLLDAGAATLDGDAIVPGDPMSLPDRLLDEAASALSRQLPHESVEEWLWRRGRGLPSTYLAALEDEPRIPRQRHHRLPSRIRRTAPPDSPARRRAAERHRSGEPVLAALVTAAGPRGKPAEDTLGVAEGPVATVLAAVDDAVLELEAVRQRRAIEQAAFDNVWRGY